MAKQMFERIENYLEASLPEEERLAFEKELAENPDLREEVKLQRDTRTLLDLHGQLSFKEKLQQLDQELASEGKRISMRRPLWQQTWVRIAAVLLILLLSSYFWVGNQYKQNYLAQSSFEPYENMLTVRSDKGRMSEAMNLYDEEEYTRAIASFQQVLKENPEAKDASLYLGISFMATGDPQSAIPHLDKAADSALYAEQANWYKVLACLQLQDYESCESQLNEIAEKGGPHKEDALKLRAKLTSIWARIAN